MRRLGSEGVKVEVCEGVGGWGVRVEGAEVVSTLFTMEVTEKLFFVSDCLYQLSNSCICWTMTIGTQAV